MIAAPFAAAAQDERTGRIVGAVDDSTGAAVADVLIIASRDDGSFVRRASTDQSGAYRLGLLPPGRYNVTAQRIGYRLAVARGLLVEANTALQLDITLKRRPVDLPGIVVRDSAILMQKGTDVGATRVGAQDIALLPVGTDISRAIELAPAARSGSLWGAGGTAANNYQMDGASLNNPGVGGAFIQPGIRWIETLEIKGLGADAQEGNFQGGVVNIVTKSGDNTRRSALEFNLEHQTLNGSNLTPTSLVPEISGRRQLIGELSGPISRDRLFYYAGADWVDGQYRLLDHLGAERNAYAPFSQQRTDVKLFGKLTFTPSDRDMGNLSVAHNLQRTEHADFTGRETFDATTSLRAPATVVNAAWQRLLGASTTVELKLTGFDGAERRTPSAGPDVPGIYTYQLATSRYYQNAPFTTDRRARSLGGSLVLDRYETVFGLQHHIRLGVDHADATWVDRRTRNGGLSWRPRYSVIDGSATAFVPENPLTWQDFTPTTWGGEADLATHTTSSAAFVQDEMRIGHFILFPGLRLGRWQGDLDPTARGVSTRTRVLSEVAIDPRMGITLDLDSADFAVKMTGHWGRYHQGTFAELFDRASGANAYTDQEVWEYSGPRFTDPRRVITVAERGALATQGQFRPIERVSLSQSGPVVDYKQPYMEQFVVALVVRPVPRWRGEFHFVSRDNKNLVALVDRNAAANFREFEEVMVYDRSGKPVLDSYGRPLVLPKMYVQNDAIVRLVELSMVADGIVLPPGVTRADINLKYQPDYAVTNPADARRRLRQYELTIGAEYPSWSGSISGVFNGLTGNFATVNGYDPLSLGGREGIVGRGPGPFVRPNESINYDGELENSSFVTIKARVFGRLPWSFRGGLVAELVSGDPMTPSFNVVPPSFRFRVKEIELHPLLIVPMSQERFYTQTQGVRRYPKRLTLDVHLERDLAVRGTTWTLSADAFNLLGSDAVTLMNTALSSDNDPNSLTKYGTPLARQAPRQIRVGTAVRW